MGVILVVVLVAASKVADFMIENVKSARLTTAADRNTHSTVTAPLSLRKNGLSLHFAFMLMPFCAAPEFRMLRLVCKVLCQEVKT